VSINLARSYRVRNLVLGLFLAGATVAAAAADPDPMQAYYGNTWELRGPDETAWIYVNADGTWGGIFNHNFFAGTSWKVDGDKACFVLAPTASLPKGMNACFRGVQDHKVGDTWKSKMDGQTRDLDATLYPGRKIPPSGPTAEEAVTLPRAEQFGMTSKAGRSFRIFVWVPQQPPPPQGYPVLVTLDANVSFAAAVNAMQLLAPADPRIAPFSASGVQPMIIVGVGYPGEGLDLDRREYDFLPEHKSKPPAPGTEAKSLPWLHAGGADAFLSFLLDELRPAIAKRYHVDPERQSLAGDSLGGYFALYALMKNPDAFRNYAAISPSLWWDNSSLVNDAASRIPLAAQGPAHHVLIAEGGDETPPYPERSAMMRDLGHAMTANLQRMGAERLNARYQEFAGEDHQAMPMASLPAVLRLASQ
jgi:hypothetical protein